MGYSKGLQLAAPGLIFVRKVLLKHRIPPLPLCVYILSVAPFALKCLHGCDGNPDGPESLKYPPHRPLEKSLSTVQSIFKMAMSQDHPSPTPTTNVWRGLTGRLKHKITHTRPIPLPDRSWAGSQGRGPGHAGRQAMV